MVIRPPPPPWGGGTRPRPREVSVGLRGDGGVVIVSVVILGTCRSVAPVHVALGDSVVRVEVARVVGAYVAGAGLVSVGVSARHVAAVHMLPSPRVCGPLTWVRLRAGHVVAVAPAAGQVVFVRQHPDWERDPALDPGRVLLAPLPAVRPPLDGAAGHPASAPLSHQPVPRLSAQVLVDGAAVTQGGAPPAPAGLLHLSQVCPLQETLLRLAPPLAAATGLRKRHDLSQHTSEHSTLVTLLSALSSRMLSSDW